MPSGNSKLSVALEHYLDGIAHKDEADLIEQALTDGNLTLSDLRVRAFKDAAKYTKMVDDLIHRQHQTMRHLQRSIDSIDYKSRLLKRMDLELAALESKQPVMCETWQIFLPACKGRSGARAGRYPAAPRTATN